MLSQLSYSPTLVLLQYSIHMNASDLGNQLEKMRRDWDERARKNARYYVNTACQNWTG